MMSVFPCEDFAEQLFVGQSLGGFVGGGGDTARGGGVAVAFGVTEVAGGGPAFGCGMENFRPGISGSKVSMRWGKLLQKALFIPGWGSVPVSLPACISALKAR